MCVGIGFDLGKGVGKEQKFIFGEIQKSFQRKTEFLTFALLKEVSLMKSDYIIVSLNNNGCAYVQLEDKAFETSRENGESWILLARMKGMKEVAWKRYENGDQQYWFN